MSISIAKLISLAALWLLLQPRGVTAEIFQWTDAKGTLHFTDNPHWIPESIKNSPALIVRKDLEVKPSSPGIEPGTAPAVVAASASAGAESEIHQTRTEASSPVERVNETNNNNSVVVFGNFQPRRHNPHPCSFGTNCQPVFRPNFADRQYIHPSVFDGGSRQYIHPGARFSSRPPRRR